MKKSLLRYEIRRPGVIEAAMSRVPPGRTKWQKFTMIPNYTPCGI